MASQIVPNTEPTEQALRERIHRIFCGDAPPSASASVPPSFWVEPTDKQKSVAVLDIHERLTLTDGLDVAADEHRWLNAPQVDLDGKSPEQMLTADDQSRERLEAFVTAVETAVRGSFS